MIRLFLILASLLSVSLGGIWYGLSRGVPLDQSTFENAPITLDMDPASEEKGREVSREPQGGAESEKKSHENEVSEGVQPLSQGGGTVAPTGLPIQLQLLRFGYRTPPVPRGIDTIVLHSSYNAQGGDQYSVDKTIAEYEQYGVGAHYLIDRSGTIYRLIEETNIAYHAGSSKMPDGRKNVNDFSIGIEMIATEESGYTDRQYTAVNSLIADIKSRYKIKSIVGHMDIAPGRKTDPWKFDWKKLK